MNINEIESIVRQLVVFDFNKPKGLSLSFDNAFILVTNMGGVIIFSLAGDKLALSEIRSAAPNSGVVCQICEHGERGHMQLMVQGACEHDGLAAVVGLLCSKLGNLNKEPEMIDLKLDSETILQGQVT